MACGMKKKPTAMKKGGMVKGKGKGGKTNDCMKKYGRNMAKVMSQKGKKS